MTELTCKLNRVYTVCFVLWVSVYPIAYLLIGCFIYLFRLPSSVYMQRHLHGEKKAKESRELRLDDSSVITF